MGLLSKVVGCSPRGEAAEYTLTCSLGHVSTISRRERDKAIETIEFPDFAMRPICPVCKCLETLMPPADPKSRVELPAAYS
jgi:hypothetical protein